jgi:hypothetical protein
MSRCSWNQIRSLASMRFSQCSKCSIAGSEYKTLVADQGNLVMKFEIRNASRAFGPEPDDAFRNEREKV